MNIAAASPMEQVIPLALFLFAGFLLTFFFVWLGRVNTRLWYWWKYQRRHGLPAELLADEVCIPDWVAVGFWPLGALILVASTFALIAGITLTNLFPSGKGTVFNILSALFLLLLLPGVLYVFAIAIKFFYNMLVHGAAMRDDAETKKVSEAERARRIANLKAALDREPEKSPLCHHRRLWLASLGDDPIAHGLVVLRHDGANKPLWQEAYDLLLAANPGKESLNEAKVLANQRGLK